VQRAPSLSGLKKAVGLKKKTPAWAKAEEAGLKAQGKKVATTKDLQKQIDTLESASRKLLKSDRGDSVEVAATQVQLGANRVLFNMDNLDEKALKQRLTKVLAETQSVLDEARMARTKRDAQNIYLEAGRKEKGEEGGLKMLSERGAFAADIGPAPAPKAAVLAEMKTRGFSTYGEFYDDAFANSTPYPEDPMTARPLYLKNLDPELYKHTNAARSRTVARGLGLSAAELAAIQAYTADDYTYVNPATANNPKWMEHAFGGKVDSSKKDSFLEQSATKSTNPLTEAQAAAVQEAAEKAAMQAAQTEASTMTGVALQGLKKLPPWKGQGFRGQGMSAKQFHDIFVKQGDGFRPRNATVTFPTITSVAKDVKVTGAFTGNKAGESDLFASVVWYLNLTNARDIALLSLNRGEGEVILLPGAQVAIESIEMVFKQMTVPGLKTAWFLKVFAKQVS
jgi:hypothetical protein